MAYRETIPHPSLAPYVDRFWTGTGNDPLDVLPDGCIDVLVDLNRGGHATAVGTMTRAQHIAPTSAVRIAAVRFRPGGAKPFLGLAASELTDGEIDCVDLHARWRATEAMSETPDERHVVRSLQALLLRWLGDTPSPHPVVSYAAQSLWRADASSKSLADAVGWTRQHLHRQFLEHVGVGPKVFARVARLQRAAARLRAQPSTKLAAIALDAGYFDQAHMAREFRQLVDRSPSEVLASSCSIHPIHRVPNGVEPMDAEDHRQSHRR